MSKKEEVIRFQKKKKIKLLFNLFLPVLTVGTRVPTVPNV